MVALYMSYKNSDNKNLLKNLDHTCLKVDATWDDIKKLIDEGIKYSVASVCIPPAYVEKARDYIDNIYIDNILNQKLKICTVIGFPSGYSTTASKVQEAKEMIELGADEIDMVINIGFLKSQQFDFVLNEIKAVKSAVQDKILKVIIETCLLSDFEKAKMCEIVGESGAEFIKTSTGFSAGGAVEEDIVLMKKHLKDGVKIKAAGGISSLEKAQDFLNLGVQRIGSSKLIDLIKS